MSETPDLMAARVFLSGVCEPGDAAAQSITAVCGPVEAARIVGGRPVGAESISLAYAALESAGYARPKAALERAQQRWGTRSSDVEPRRLLAWARSLGAEFIGPESPVWPSGLADLGLRQPFGLWVRGPGRDVPNPAERLLHVSRVLAVVGSREATAYGLAMTQAIAGAAGREGVTVLSGGAFGVDRQAHVSALTAAADPSSIPTIAVMAGGVDRFYPQANEELFRRMLGSGVLLSETAPGCAPTRWRFLQRNRLIAAMSEAVAVTEARLRSGALSTAHHALAIGRPVGCVPGNTTLSSSAGCNALIRDSGAQLIARPEDALSLLPGRIPAALEQESRGPGFSTGRKGAEDRVTDSLTEIELAVFEATPVRRPAPPERICRAAGVPAGQTLRILAELELRGLLKRQEGGWARSPGRRR